MFKKIVSIIALIALSMLFVGWIGWGSPVRWFKDTLGYLYTTNDMAIRDGHKIRIYNSDNSQYIEIYPDGVNWSIKASDGVFNFKPEGDSDDYIFFTTSGNIPIISASGGSLLKFRFNPIPYTDSYYSFGSSTFKWKSIFFSENSGYTPESNEFYVNGDTLFYYDGTNINYWLKDGVK